MDRLRQIEVFMAVAARLGMSRANVTKQISALERQFGVQLLNRNTRHVAPTEAGLLLDKGGRLLGDFLDIQAGLRRTAANSVGVIRVGVPPSFGAVHLVPGIAAFISQYPGMQIVMCLDRGDAELVRDGLDLSLRIAGALRDASYIARLLVHVPQVLVAAPSYLDRRGVPGSLADLADRRLAVPRGGQGSLSTHPRNDHGRFR